MGAVLLGEQQNLAAPAVMMILNIPPQEKLRDTQVVILTVTQNGL